MTAWKVCVCAGLMAVLLVPMTAIACSLPAGWTPMDVEGEASTRAAISKPETPIQVGQPFAIDIAICAAGAKVVERIKVDAVMPRHRHGMNYQPKIVQTGPNGFRADPLLFHMPGLWRISMKAYQGAKLAHFSLDVTVE